MVEMLSKWTGQWFDKSPTVNQALFNPDWIYGMMNPHSPAANKLLVWHTYSGQGYGIFHGDLDFYFGGFDARDRVHKIDVSKCPIYFLTGELQSLGISVLSAERYR